MNKHDAERILQYAMSLQTQEYKTLGICYDTEPTRYGFGIRLIDCRTLEITERYGCNRKSLKALLTEVKTNWDNLSLTRDGRFIYHK